MKDFFCVSVFFILSFSLPGKTKLDSLLSDIKNNSSDTSKSLSCSLAGFEYILINNGDSAISITAKGYDLAKRSDFLKGMAKCLVTQGVAYTIKNNAKKAKELLFEGEKIWIRLSNSKNKKNQYFANIGLGSVYNNLALQFSDNGDLNNALLYHNKALYHRRLAGDKAAIANSCNNISVIHSNLGNLSMAIEFSFNALKIYEELRDSVRMGKAYGNLGLHYEDMLDYPKAIEYGEKALYIGKRFNRSELIGSTLNNLGSVYMKTGKPQEAIRCFNEALEIYSVIGNKMEQSNIISNLGSLFLKKKETKAAFDYFVRSLQLKREIEDKGGESISLGNIAQYFFEIKDYREAVIYADSALIIAKPLGNINDMRDFHLTLYRALSQAGKYEKALFHYEQHILLNDSIMKEENKKAGIKKQLQYDYEKRAAADSIKNMESQKVKDAELAAQNAMLKEEKTQRYFLLGGLTFVAAGLFFVINRFRITRKQKRIIEIQKKNVDIAFDRLHEKNKEVLDSIYYARRIQRALLTSHRYIERNLDKLNPPSSNDFGG